jgi:hypothetical protein
MGKLIYAAMTSLDGFIEDVDGGFAWAEPDAEVHAFANDLERSTRTHLYGRRMYETMEVWQTTARTDRGVGAATEAGGPPVMLGPPSRCPTPRWPRSRRRSRGSREAAAPGRARRRR